MVQEINPSYGTDELTDFLEMVSQRCKFAYWFFGHYHEDVYKRQDPKKRTFRVWYLIANPRGLPKEFVQKELEFRWKLFPEKKEETK